MGGFLVYFTCGTLVSVGVVQRHADRQIIVQTVFSGLTWLLLLRCVWEVATVPDRRQRSVGHLIMLVMTSSAVYYFPVCSWELHYWGIPRVVNEQLVIGWLLLMLVGFCGLVFVVHHQQEWLKACLLSFCALVVGIGGKAINQLTVGLANYGLCLLWLLGVVLATDAGGFIGGILWGKHKLVPAISPQKTVEGLGCGLAAGITVGILFSFGLIWIAPSYSLFAPFTNRRWVRYVISAGLTLLLCGAAVAGDLLFSQLKRSYQTKDFRRLIVGHGGLLDRLDSLFMAAVVLFFISFYFTNPNLY